MSTNDAVQLAYAIAEVASPHREIDWINLITAITALVAVIAGTIVGIYGVNRQTRATVHSQHRQAWINALRENIASLLTVFQRAKALIMKEGPIDQTMLTNLTFEAKQAELTIALQLNPTERDHNALLELIRNTWLLVGDNQQDIIENERQIVRLTQVVLKREWERVKAIK